MPTEESRSSGGGSKTTPRPSRTRREVAGDVVTTAAREGGRHSDGKGVRGGAMKGAAKGAATGAALGSVVPGVGTAAGAGVGAAAGGMLGAAGGARQTRADRRAARDVRRAQRSPATRILIAEFIACTIVLALSPMTTTDDVAPRMWMKRGTALSALFVALGLVAAIGPRAGRAAAAFGGLVTLALVIDQRSIFGAIAEKFGGGVEAPEGPATDEPPFDAPDPDPSSANPPRSQGTGSSASPVQRR